MLKKPRNQALVTKVVLGVTLCVSASLAWSEDHSSAFVTLWHGTFEAGFTQQGELQRCESDQPNQFGQFTLTHRHPFDSLSGVCDDQSARKCAGRITAVFERCTDRDIDHVNDPETGLATTTYGRGLIRICFDDVEPLGDCDESHEVARGIVRVHIPMGIFPNPVGEGQTFDDAGYTVDEERITHSRRFKLDGKRVRVRRGLSIGESQFRFNDSCIFGTNACPASGFLTPIGRRGERDD